MKNILIISLFAIILLGSTVAGLNQVVLYANNGTNTDVPVEIDRSTRAVSSIDYSHHEIHNGNHFSSYYCDNDVDIGEEAELLIITPDTTKYSHLIFKFTSTGNGSALFSENPTVTDVGSNLVELNSNRNSGNAATLVVNHTPTTTAPGDGLWGSLFGLSTGPFVRVGGEQRNENEFILKRNEDYLFSVSTLIDNNSICLYVDWYEHTDKP